MKYRAVVDPTLWRFGDILTVTSLTSELSALIRAFSEWQDYLDLVKVITSFRHATTSSHALFVTEPEKLLGREMRWPDEGECSLQEYVDGKAAIIGLYRCPWLTKKFNPDADQVCLERLHRFFEDFHSQYGVYNFTCFLTHLPQDKEKVVCSMYVLLGIIVSTICQGFNVPFPNGWVVAGESNTPWPGLVKPSDLDHHFNSLGWSKPFLRYEEK
jgi:hypothetical protein